MEVSLKEVLQLFWQYCTFIWDCVVRGMWIHSFYRRYDFTQSIVTIIVVWGVVSYDFPASNGPLA